MVRFIVLDNKTSIEAKASDHHPIIMGDVCTFNLLSRCEITTHYANNGFLIEETIEEYRARLLNKVLLIIRELIEKYHVHIFAFQEAPPMTLTLNCCEDEYAIFDVAHEFYMTLKDSFSNYVIDSAHYRSMSQGSDACGLLLMHHKAYEVEKEITQEVMNGISRKNKSRFQAFSFHKYNDKPTSLKLMNIHADFNNQNGTKNDIENLVTNGFIVAGDFNLKRCPEIKNCSQKILITDPGLMPYDTYDGIIVKKGHAQHLIADEKG